MRPVRLFVQRGQGLTSVAVQIWALAAQLSRAGSPEVTSAPGCAPAVPQLPGSRSQKRCVWQVSLDLLGGVWDGLGLCTVVVGLLGENLPGQWNRMGFWSRPEHLTPLSLLREQEQALAVTKHQTGTCSSISAWSKLYAKPQRVKFYSSLPSCKVMKLVLAESRVCGTRKWDRRHKQGEQAVGSDTCHRISSTCMTCCSQTGLVSPTNWDVCPGKWGVRS